MRLASNVTTVNQNGIIELMNSIPKQTDQPQIQIYWQPIAVPNHMATIQHLQRQNAYLKDQLARLQNQQGQQIHQRNLPNTASQHSTLSSTTRSPQPQLCLSPRNMPHQRMFSNMSPQPNNFLSPRVNNTCKHSIILEQHLKTPENSHSRRLKENKFQNDQSQSTFSTQQQKMSGFFKMNSPQNFNYRSPLKNQQVQSPMRFSQLSNNQQGLTSKPLSRMHSPSFLKNKQRKISTPFPNIFTLHQQAKMTESGWEDPSLNRSISHTYSVQPTKDSQKSRSKSKSPDWMSRSPMRDSIRLPTVDLSMQRSSQISIDKAIRQFRKKGKQEHRDTFLYEMEQKLDTLYGVNDSL